MLPTPDTSHVSFNRVYEPAEDSFLLLDTLVSDSEKSFLRDRFSGLEQTPLVVEVGTGSGVVLAFTAENAVNLFGRRDVLLAGTDVNVFACHAAKITVENVLKNRSSSLGAGTFLDTIGTDLTSNFRKCKIDVLIFNPPYVPTEELPDMSALTEDQAVSKDSKTTFEEDSYLLSLSYAGGAGGMETTNRLLNQLPEILNPMLGVAYVLLCAQNKPALVIQQIKSWATGWKVAAVGQSGKTGGWEKLQILRIWKE